MGNVTALKSLSSERRARLDAIGFNWNPSKSRGEIEIHLFLKIFKKFEVQWGFSRQFKMNLAKIIIDLVLNQKGVLCKNKTIPAQKLKRLKSYL